MAIAASVVFSTARTLLNDDANSLWTDAVLLPKLVEAFRELQAKLKASAASVMRAEAAQNIAIGVTTLVLPADLIAPIKLWEKAQAGANSTYIPMTEKDPLPLVAQTTTLIYWQWYQQAINLIGSTVSRTVKIQYWRALTEPTSNASDLVILESPLFLAPRVAGLAAGSVGEKDAQDNWTEIAMSNLDFVIIANRGRVSQTDRP